MGGTAISVLHRRALIAGACAAAALCGLASGDVITDASFFTTISRTLIDFETDGAGAPVILAEGFGRAMPSNEYSALGLTVSAGVNWVNDAGPLFDAAQAIGGSPNNAIPAGVNDFTLTFSNPVQAFGLWTINNRTRDAAGPQMRVYAADNTLLTTLQFDDGGIFVDGLLSNGTTDVDYGFMGFASNIAISRVEISKISASFDDLYFSSIPSAGPVALLGCGLAVAALRRRRA